MAWLGPLISGGLGILGHGLESWLQQKRMKDAMTGKVLLDTVLNTQGPAQEAAAVNFEGQTGIQLPRYQEQAPAFTPAGGGAPMDLQQVSTQGPQMQGGYGAFDVQGPVSKTKLALPTPSLDQQIADMTSKDPRMKKLALQHKFGMIGKPEFVNLPGQAGTVAVSPTQDMVLPPGTTKFGQTDPYDMARFKEELIRNRPKDYKPELLFPTSGKGPAIWANPGDPIPDNYTPLKGMGSKLSYENKEALLDGIERGDIPPSMPSKRAGDYNELLAMATKRDINLSKLETQYQAAKRFAGSMNSQQMVRFKGLAGSVVNTIDEVNVLAQQLQQSGITPLNNATLVAKMKFAGNTEAGQLATRYLAAVNTLKEEFANLAQGGYAPTEAAWALANKQINENYGVNQMQASLKEVQRLINFRVKAFDELEAIIPGKSGGGAPATKGGDMWNAPAPPKAGKVQKFVGPGKYNGRLIRSQEEFNATFGGAQ